MIRSYLRLFRVIQWIKNLFVFVPLLFSKHLFEQDYFSTAFAGFIIFSLASSIIYAINDIIDVEADRNHPSKKDRPIASGKIKPSSAIAFSSVLLIVVILLTLNYDIDFGLTVFSFIILNIVYSLSFKHIVILDVFSIAAGFMLRVIAGALIINVEISSWLLLTTMFLSLFLGVMKRYSELNLAVGKELQNTRKVLSQYSEQFATQMATIASAGVIICYALYTVSERTIEVFGTENLIYTTPIVVFGIFRYMFLVYLYRQGENTTEIMITDIPMIITVLVYISASVLIIYKLI